MTEHPKSDEIVRATTMSGFINPLKFLAVEALGSSERNPALDGTSILKDLTYPDYLPKDLIPLHHRYVEITAEEITQSPKGLFIAPDDTGLLGKVVWPLRQAKASYVLGNYIGTIALCGMVAEMTTILLFELNPSSKLSVADFERQGQKNRVRFLSGKKIMVERNDIQDKKVIDDGLKTRLDKIRNLRRSYLHYFSQNDDSLPKDSRRIYKETVAAVVAVVGQEIKDGRLVVTPEFTDYLKREGVLK